MSLEEASIKGRITINGILSKANQEASNCTIKSETYKDGGSTEWYYDTYTILKCHTVNGNRDVYIGTNEMKITDII